MSYMSEVDVMRKNFEADERLPEEVRTELFRDVIMGLIAIGCKDDARAISEVYLFKEKDNE